jgi:hypothetical protein
MWETTLLTGKSELHRFCAFIKKERIDNVFLAVPYDPAVSGKAGGLSPERRILAPIVRALNASGSRVHALMGDKDFILPDSRDFVRKSIRNTVEYNKLVSPEERFYAIHLDIEPYLFPGFASSRRHWFLDNFIETLAECSRIAHEGGMRIGADIPFWLDGADELTHLPMLASLNGDSKPVYQHVLDLMDNIALMDYRTPIAGEDQIFLFAAKELAYADEIRKEVFVGLETAPLPDETVLTFTGRLQQGVPEPRSGMQYMLVLQEDRTLIAALAATREEISDFLKKNRAAEREHFFWPVERATKIGGNALSFASLGMGQFQSAMKTNDFALRMYRSFAGFAIHHYGSYLKMK